LITLIDGTAIACDEIVAGIGAIPETSLAQAAGLVVENGIAVDACLRTSDPDIYAAGDCCSFPHPLYGGQRIRLEAWRNAQDQGLTAAHNLAGAEEVYSSVPWFWSDHYDLTLRVAGLADRGAVTVERSEREDGNGNRLFFHLSEEGTLMAVSGIGVANIAKEMRVAEMLVERRAQIDHKLLANPSIKLKSLLKL